MKLPPFPLLPERNLIKPNQFCNSSTVEGCKNDYCACTHVLQVKINSVVELLLIDEGMRASPLISIFLFSISFVSLNLTINNDFCSGVPYDANHPFHLHGYQFRVVAMEKIGSNITAAEVKELDRQGLINRTLTRAPLKDTVTVPDGGYTIVRFHANNPGKITWHAYYQKKTKALMFDCK